MIRWTALGSKGAGSFVGNCDDNAQEFCRTRMKRPESAQVVDNPDPVNGPPKMFRYEVKWGDNFPNESDVRCLSSGPWRIWRDNGDEAWYRWYTLQPPDWVGNYPKWDQLYDWPKVKHDAGVGMHFHHEPFGGGTEPGSAPIYTGADNDKLWLALIDQATSTTRKAFTLAPLKRGHAYEWLFHVKWSWDEKVGFIELWLDGELVIPKYTTHTMYPQTRIYPAMGLYRNYNIGGHTDQNGNPLIWRTDAKPGVVYPSGFVPKKGELVFKDDNGTPGVQYIGGVALGDTREDVMAVYPSKRGGVVATTPDLGPPTANPKAQAGLQQLIAQRTLLEPLVAQADQAITQITALRDAAKKVLGDTVALLNQGPW
jgi:hypothetical protein